MSQKLRQILPTWWSSLGPAGLPEPSDDDDVDDGDDVDDVDDIDDDDDVRIYEERDCGSQGGKGPGIPR